MLQRLCLRLAVDGDVDVAGCDAPLASTTYDARLQDGVRRFQERHGLEVDGVVGASTVVELNMSAAARADQLAVNVARRLALADPGDVHVLVNIPAFSATLVERGRDVLRLRVITGTVRTPTPEFSAMIVGLEIRPSWKLPDSIYYKEVLPKLRRDAGELAREHYEVLDLSGRVVDPSGIDWAREARRYRLRQTPGAHNALGLLKFMLAEPARRLPARHAGGRPVLRPRARLQPRLHPRAGPAVAGGGAVAGDPRWTREALAAAMADAESRAVPLPTPVPVHIVYFTATVVDGQVRFYPDVYGRDARAAGEALAPSAGARTSARQIASEIDVNAKPRQLQRRHHQRRSPLRRADRFHVPRRQHRQHALVEAQVAHRDAESGPSPPTTGRRG